jgi:hypothetical protein
MTKQSTQLSTAVNAVNEAVNDGTVNAVSVGGINIPPHAMTAGS